MDTHTNVDLFCGKTDNKEGLLVSTVISELTSAIPAS
jgi:hypothetical protein